MIFFCCSHVSPNSTAHFVDGNVFGIDYLTHRIKIGCKAASLLQDITVQFAGGDE